MKDELAAEMLRKEGNIKFKQEKFKESLIFYNQSLCLSPSSSGNFSLIFGNRSAVYLKMGLHEKCLENIELALQEKHPNEEKLKKRREKCLESHGNRENSEKFFSLSHPANKTIPFIANCLKLCQDNNFSNGIVTTEDLNPGDVVAIEEICFKTIEGSARFRRCAFCLSSNNFSLIPCNRGCACSK
jgi:tetratricopeptide (TPR) repeat protein